MQRIAGLAGIVGPIVFMTVLTVAGLLRPGYDPWTRFSSDLAVGDGGWLQAANFAVFGASVLLLGMGVREAFARDGEAVSFLLGTAGVGLMMMGVFVTDLSGQPDTLHGEVHFAGVILSFASLLGVFFLAPRPFARDQRWSSYSRYTIVTGIVAALLCLAAVASAPPATFNGFRAGPLAPWTGLAQRALFAAAFAWISAVGYRLAALARAHPARANRLSCPATVSSGPTLRSARQRMRAPSMPASAVMANARARAGGSPARPR